MNTSQSIAKIAASLLSAQKMIQVAKKSAKNPFFKSSYADLGEVIECVKGPLNQCGITFLQLVGTCESGPMVETVLLHESGEYISTITPVRCAKENDPQAFGSGVTYSKRYSLQAMLGLPTEDDDGEGAMSRPVQDRQLVKPAVDVVKLRSESGAKFLAGFKTADEAIASIAKTKTVTDEAAQAIRDFFQAVAA